MKVALVHDYLNEFGGAEQVLLTLSELFPEAPIYTAFYVKHSSSGKAFHGKKIITSWFGKVPFYTRLYSPLRFLIPWIWKSFDLRSYDVIISSASWYITKGFVRRPGQIEICYCHTPPRWLYGYTTSVNMQKYFLVRVYALIVGHFLRMYDFEQAQKVTQFVANSQNVARRIQKFYRRESRVIYPPVTLHATQDQVTHGDYYLMVCRIVGGKGIELAVEAAEKMNFKLVIAGEMRGYKQYDFSGYKNVSYVGRVDEAEKQRLMTGAKGFLALARDEDFGITPVEAQLAGTPVIAYKGGGYTETVVDGTSGVLFEDYSVEGLLSALERFERMTFSKKALVSQGQKFSKERFKTEVLQLVKSYARVAGN